jgi:hypothetical protein
MWRALPVLPRSRTHPRPPYLTSPHAAKSLSRRDIHLLISIMLANVASLALLALVAGQNVKFNPSLEDSFLHRAVASTIEVGANPTNAASSLAQRCRTNSECIRSVSRCSSQNQGRGREMLCCPASRGCLYRRKSSLHSGNLEGEERKAAERRGLLLISIGTQATSKWSTL